MVHNAIPAQSNDMLETSSDDEALLIDLILERVARKSLEVMDMWWVPLIVSIMFMMFMQF